MCLLAIQFQATDDAPLLIAHNREELYDRPTQPPRIQSGKPRVVCGIDRKAGGTWFGVNQYGMAIAVANRLKATVPADPRSRGLLCRELLACRTARDAAKQAERELGTGCYAGANYICADADWAGVVYGGSQIKTIEIKPGLHLIGNGNLDDHRDQRMEFVRRLLTLQRLDSAVAFLAVASRAFSRESAPGSRQGAIVRSERFGTVSSTLLSLPTKSQNAVYQYAPGPPSEHAYDDLSALLRQVLSTDR